MYIKYILIPCKLFNESDRLFAEQSSKLTNCIFRAGNNIPDYDMFIALQQTAKDAGDELDPFILLADGKLTHISNYKKIYDNIDIAYETSLSIYKVYLETINSNSGKDMHDIYKEELNKAMLERANYSSTKEEAEKHKLEYMMKCMIITSLYTIDESILDESINNEEMQDAIMKAIKEERSDNEDDIQNELDIVGSIIKKYFPKDYEKFEYKKCIYNGEEISPDEMSDKLMSHVLPQYLTQVNINDTLNDTYTIESNLGTIVREQKTGKIIILKNS
jgi:hypothetical protein